VSSLLPVMSPELSMNYATSFFVYVYEFCSKQLLNCVDINYVDDVATDSCLKVQAGCWTASQSL